MTEFRFALRSLWRSPTTTIVAVLALALGIGATTAMFSVVYSVALKPLPWPDAERIVRVSERMPDGMRGRGGGGFLLNDIRAWRDESRAFEGIAGYMGRDLTLTGFEEPYKVSGLLASVDLFRVLGATQLAGRTFQRSDEDEGNEGIVVLSEALASRLFVEPEKAVGQSLQLDDSSHLVIGVMPGDFAFPDRSTEIWKPLYWEPPEDENNRRELMLPVIGRLAREATLAGAEVEGNAFVAAHNPRGPEGQEPEERSVTLETLGEQRYSSLREPLRLLSGAVLLVLLLACVNVANLLLARGAHRQREMATRLSLGASRRRVVRQMLSENLVLAGIGGTLGVVLALACVQLLRLLEPSEVLDFDTLTINGPVLGFAALAAVLAALLFGALPALQASATRPGAVLGSRGESAGRGVGSANWLRSGLALVQVALAIVLLAGAGLLANSFLRLVRVDAGYDPNNLLTFRLAAPPTRYPPGEQLNQFYDRVLEDVRSVEGVESAGLVNFLPLFRGRIQLSLQFEGRPPPTDPREAPVADARFVSDGYFETMKIRLLAGRTFTERDRADAPPVIVVNQSLVDRYLEGEDPIGMRVQQMGEIVGVVADVKLQGLDSEPGPTFYAPFTQLPPMMAGLFSRMAVVARTPDPMGLLPAVRSRLLLIDSQIPVEDARTMASRLSESVATPRFYATVLAIFAGIALVLAVTGVYGVLSFNASRKSKETGIRMALGAQRGEVIRRTLLQGLALTGGGIVVGAGAALVLSRALSSLLFGVEPGDPTVLVGVSLLLLVTAGLASLLPARRAASVNPVTVLREE